MVEFLLLGIMSTIVPGHMHVWVQQYSAGYGNLKAGMEDCCGKDREENQEEESGNQVLTEEPSCCSKVWRL